MMAYMNMSIPNCDGFTLSYNFWLKLPLHNFLLLKGGFSNEPFLEDPVTLLEYI